MAKKRVGKFPTAFRQMAVNRLEQCDNIVALAKELGISRRLLYTWREKLEPLERSGEPARECARGDAPERGQPTQAGVGREGLGGGFFKGALQHVEARRQRSGKAGAPASMPRSRR